MSYIIQNFYEINKKINLTPRFKLFLFLNNLNKFFIFIKINTFLNLTNKPNVIIFNYFFLFFKSFFSKQYFKILIQNDSPSITNYINNFSNSCTFSIFFFINNYFKHTVYFIKKFQNYFTYLSTLYILPIKVLNLKLNKLFYKNLFFFYLLTTSFLWYQHSSYFKFYLNFLFADSHFKLSRFYNGHFLKTHNA